MSQAPTCCEYPPVTLHEWAPVSGTRTGSVRSQASELYSSSWKLEPVADDCTDAAHTEMLRSVQCCRLNLQTHTAHCRSSNLLQGRVLCHKRGIAHMACKAASLLCRQTGNGCTSSAQRELLTLTCQQVNPADQSAPHS
jgi:hypothetical protein